MTNTRITFDNFSEFPAGTTVEFNFGAYYPTVDGIVTGYRVTPATKHFPASVCLTAKYMDPDTDEIRDIDITSFVEKGIGTYLLDVADKGENNSPWAKEY